MMMVITFSQTSVPASYTLLFSYLSYHDMEQEIEVVGR